MATTVGKKFLSTPSARRATVAADKVAHVFIISIHALREEGDSSIFLSAVSSRHFYPRPPRGGRRRGRPGAYRTIRISIHALREEGDDVLGQSTAHIKTFLSTPSARRATSVRLQALDGRVISIHALREEGDPGTPITFEEDSIFLSTPSARRATAKTEKNISAFVSL